MTQSAVLTSPRTVNARTPGAGVSREKLIEKVMENGTRKRDAERAVDFYLSRGTSPEELLERVLNYADPTGDTAVRNVTRAEG